MDFFCKIILNINFYTCINYKCRIQKYVYVPVIPKQVTIMLSYQLYNKTKICCRNWWTMLRPVEGR